MDKEKLIPKIVLRDFVNELNQKIGAEKKHNRDVNKWGDDIWTKVIKEVFWGMGRNNDFKVYTTLHGGEYLLDLLWESKNEEHGGLILGLESEWGNVRDVEEDFYKLIYTKCKLKVMVYSSTSAGKEIELKNMFREGLFWFNNHSKGDDYLLINITNYKPYKIVGHRVIIPNDFIVNRNAIEFNKLDEFGWDEVDKVYRR